MAFMRNYHFSFFIFFLPLLILVSCAPDNPHQAMGDFLPVVALQRACVSGRVTDAATGRGIPGAVLEVAPPITGPPITTNRDGFFYAEFPGGNLHIRFIKAGYRDVELSLFLKQGDTAGREVSLEPVAPVIVDAGNTVSGVPPGAVVLITARVTARDGSHVKKVHWSVHQEEGEVAAAVTNGDSLSAQVTLPEEEAYKQALLYRLGMDARLLDRFMVLGLTPSDLLWAGKVALKVTVTTTSGSYSDTVDIVADLGSFAEIHTGLQNVAIGKRIFLQGKKQPSYAWSLTVPAGSTAVLKDETTQNPSFTPDKAGIYTLLEGNRERLTIHAGTLNGVLVAKETETRPRWIGAQGCMCHFTDKIATKFHAWRQSGHAEIFTRCITTVFRYEQRCFACHTVGFGEKITGISSSPDFPDFLHNRYLWNLEKIPPVVIPRPGNLEFLIDTYPDTAKMANVQCENCHGPTNSTAHKTLKTSGATERISLHSQVCGSCHDETFAEEPSFQKWLTDKKHSNYNRAIEVATVERKGEQAGDCGRCHAAQGFLAWVARGNRSLQLSPIDSIASRDYLTAIGLSEEKVHPITCAVCHDSHSPGSTFRFVVEKVPVREVDHARMHPPEFGDAGGRGAICITCHSTIWGAYNDATYPLFAGDIVPHAGQSDVLFGRNAFFVQPGSYSSHAGIEDTCVWCHVKQVPKPGTGYPIRGADHTFKAHAEICGKCHAFTADELMDAVEKELEDLKGGIEDALSKEIQLTGSLRIEPLSSGEGATSVSSAGLRKPQLVEFERKPAVEITTTGGTYRIPIDRLSLGGKRLLETDSGQILAKAMWNYFLIRKDGSKGAHNPQFVREVLATTSENVDRLYR